MSLLQKLFFLDEASARSAEKDGARERPAVTSAAGFLALCFFVLLDNSGSMQGTDIPPSRIQVACQAVIQMLRFLLERSPLSYVGIGTFAHDFHRCSEPLQVGKDFNRLVASLSNLGEPGSTQMKKGLLGIRKMMKSCPPDLKIVVIMLTDGCNTGRSPVNTAKEIVTDGADIWTIGIGASPSDVEEDLLRRLASKPEQYIFIGNYEGPEAIINAFQRVAGIYFVEDQE